jgi:hypothetical protein
VEQVRLARAAQAAAHEEAGRLAAAGPRARSAAAAAPLMPAPPLDREQRLRLAALSRVELLHILQRVGASAGAPLGRLSQPELCGVVQASALARACFQQSLDARAPRCASQIAGYLLHSGGIPKETART